MATSLIDHDGLPRDLTSVLLTILDQFDLRWRELLASGFASLADAYRQRCFLTGRTVTIQQPGGQTLVGVCHGIDHAGVLRLRGLAGEHRVRSGTVLSWE